MNHSQRTEPSLLDVGMPCLWCILLEEVLYWRGILLEEKIEGSFKDPTLKRRNCVWVIFVSFGLTWIVRMCKLLIVLRRWRSQAGTPFSGKDRTSVSRCRNFQESQLWAQVYPCLVSFICFFNIYLSLWKSILDPMNYLCCRPSGFFWWWMIWVSLQQLKRNMALKYFLVNPDHEGIYTQATWCPRKLTIVYGTFATNPKTPSNTHRQTPRTWITHRYSQHVFKVHRHMDIHTCNRNLFTKEFQDL